MEELAEELDPLWFSKFPGDTFGGGTEENVSPVVLHSSQEMPTLGEVRRKIYRRRSNAPGSPLHNEILQKKTKKNFQLASETQVTRF